MRSNIFNTRKSVYLFVVAILFFGLSSWGFLVHRTINQIAIYSLPAPLQSFFHQDMEYLVENAWVDLFVTYGPASEKYIIGKIVILPSPDAYKDDYNIKK